MAIYMKYGNIQGDATQKGLEGWINLRSFEWKLERKFAKDQVGRAFNREAAQADVKEVIVTKELDHSSGELLKATSTASKGETCEIVFLRTGNPGEPYLKFILTDALFKNLSLSPSQTPERPTEKLIIDFTKLQIEVKALDEANQNLDTMRIQYNIATGEGG